MKFLELWAACSFTLPAGSSPTVSSMDSAKPHPPDTRPHRPLFAPGAERVHVSGGTRYTYRQVGWIGHRDGAMYAIGEDPSQFEPGGWSPLYVITDADDVLVDHLPQPAASTRS